MELSNFVQALHRKTLTSVLSWLSVSYLSQLNDIPVIDDRTALSTSSPYSDGFLAFRFFVTLHGWVAVGLLAFTFREHVYLSTTPTRTIIKLCTAMLIRYVEILIGLTAERWSDSRDRSLSLLFWHLHYMHGKWPMTNRYNPYWSVCEKAVQWLL